MVLSESYCMP